MAQMSGSAAAMEGTSPRPPAPLVPVQAYRSHTDYFPVGTATHDYDHNFDPKTGGANRYATVRAGLMSQWSYPVVVGGIRKALQGQLGLPGTPHENT